MATVLDRPPVETLAPNLSRPPRESDQLARLRGSDLSVGVGVAQWLVAALLLAAGALHFAIAPSHFGESTAEGIGFVAAAWLQVALAVAVVLRPSRRVAISIVAVSVACIGAWAVSRTVGLPFGQHAGHAESVTIVDGMTVVMEGAAIVLAAALLSPRVRRIRARGLAFVACLAVLALTSALIGAPETRDHAATAHGGVGGHVHGASAASGSHAALTDLNGHVIQGVKGHDVAQELQPDKLLDPQTRAALAVELVAARNAAMQYPTVADAERAGYHLVGGGYGPGAGAHYIRFGGGTFGRFDPSKPPTLIYDGTSPTAQVIGLMYLGMGQGGSAPEGFAGPNDHWHRHSGVCLKGVDVIFPVDASVTQTQCSAKGGSFMNVTTWMVHAWVVPGWESPAGVFSHENPDLPCADGTLHTDSIGRCKGPGDVS